MILNILKKLPDDVFPGDDLPGTFPAAPWVVTAVTAEAGFATAINCPPTSLPSTCDEILSINSGFFY